MAGVGIEESKEETRGRHASQLTRKERERMRGMVKRARVALDKKAGERQAVREGERESGTQYLFESLIQHAHLILRELRQSNQMSQGLTAESYDGCFFHFTKVCMRATA